MSTDHYGVRVLESDPDSRRVRVRDFVVYYDTHYEQHQPIPDDCSFEQDGRWVDEEKLVQADFNVWLTKSEYVSGIPVDLSVGTA